MSFRGGNGTGPATVHVSREQDMAIFDSLPPQVRRAMSESWFNRTAVGVRPQIATIGAERAAVLLGAGGACDQALVREEKRQAEMQAVVQRIGFGAPRPRPFAGGQRERVY
ncbi:MAG TPA: hypothetical protein VJP88_00260 [Caulobacteraceae bacterium]|nr:hypothetical protein [Caulobacteraceae bacterium]